MSEFLRILSVDCLCQNLVGVLFKMKLLSSNQTNWIKCTRSRGLAIVFWNCLILTRKSQLLIFSCFVSSLLSAHVCLVAQPCQALGHNRLLCSWDPPGKNNGVGYPSLLQVTSWPRNQIQVSCIVGGVFTSWATKEVHC